MKNEERLSSSQYNFDYFDDQRKVYAFQTSSGIVYEAVVKPSGYIFPNEPQHVQENVYEFSILIAENPATKMPPPDGFIPNTIAAIFQHFFQNHMRVVVYVYETADFCSAVRLRKFNQWFDLYKTKNVMKVELPLGEDTNGQLYYVSMISLVTNPELLKITEAFYNLIYKYKK